jgi:hypothetical protein
MEKFGSEWNFVGSGINVQDWIRNTVIERSGSGSIPGTSDWCLWIRIQAPKTYCTDLTDPIRDVIPSPVLQILIWYTLPFWLLDPWIWTGKKPGSGFLCVKIHYFFVADPGWKSRIRNKHPVSATTLPKFWFLSIPDLFFRIQQQLRGN